jgi:exosortase D (VPLPA-CTERM-specific)
MEITKTRTYWKAICIFLTFVLAVTFIFRSAGETILQSWSQEEYSHGYLIPPLALLLLLNKMADSRIVPKNSWLGFSIVAVSVAAAFLFEFAGVIHLLPVFYVMSLIGIAVLFLGPKATRGLAGPLILLFFAVPLPIFLYYTLSSHMQMASSSLGVIILNLLNISVFQDGNIIDLGEYKLNVVEACSGVRYLFPLLSLSFLLAYMYRAPFWKRAFVFLSTVPIAILLNGLRIALIGVTVDQWGPAMAEGFIHDFEGFVVFLAGFLFLLLEIKLLQKIGARDALQFDGMRIPSLKKLPLLTLGKPSAACGIFLVLAVAFSAALPELLPHYLTPVYLRQPFNNFPLQIGEWSGQTSTLSEKALRVLGTDYYLMADYVKSDEPPVNLYVLYYPQQDSTSNEAVHTPTVCIPGGGWTVESKTTKTLPVNDPASVLAQPLAVNRMLISKEMTRQVVYYWYMQENHSTPSPGATRIHAFMNSLTHGHTNGALLRFVTTIRPGETEQDAENRLNAFMNKSLPMLYGYMFEVKN